MHTVVVKPGDEVAGRYRLEELQGHGPMSEVWRAQDRTLDRTVALKILAPTADLARFRREAQALAALAHANIMRVYDYGEDDAGPFMALEWLSGGTLEDRLARGALPRDEVHRVAAGVAAGLAHLHGRDLVHRDLKPANILFDAEGRPKLGDFGLARGAAGSTLTEAGTVLGTAAYISPEQAAGQQAGPTSDVYSFGVILFRMLTGALPFVADDALALANMHRHAPPPAVEELRPDASPTLAALTAATLRKDPADRPADGEALLHALGAATEPFLVAADAEATQVLPAASAVGTAARRSRRGAAAAAVALVLLATAGGVLAWAVTRPGAAEPVGLVSTDSPRTQRPTHAAATQTTLPGTTQAQGQVRRHEKRTKHGRTTIAPTTAPATTTFPTTTFPTTTTTAPTTTTVPTTTESTTAGAGTTTTGTT